MRLGWLMRFHTGGLGAAVLALAVSAAAQSGPVVRLDSGEVRGVEGFATQAFLGVPFAAPPVGALRWKAPEQVEAWAGMRDATHLAQPCAAPLSGDGLKSLSEDCLYLDVYRPSGVKAGEKLPVMVFLHGGGNIWGSPNIYDGVRMAEVGHAVVVVPAYRLNAFGLLALPSMGENAGTFLLQDQLAALKWVARNVGAFGGDAMDVTVSGQSAGAGDTCALVASPAAAGLFRQAIVQSGSCETGDSMAQAEATGEAFAKKLGCDGKDAEACLKAKTVDEILAAWSQEPSAKGAAPYGGPLLPIGVGEAVASGKINKVPVLIGFAEDELWPFQHGLYPLSEEGYQKQLADDFQGRAAKVAELYPETAFPHREYVLGAELGDETFICPALASASVLAKSTRVSVYEFADRTVPPFKSLGPPIPRPAGYNPGAFHTSELQYLYNYQSAEGPLSETQRRLGDKMIKLWVGFNRGKNDGWPLYGQDKMVMRLGADGVSIAPSNAVYENHKCSFWNAK